MRPARELPSTPDDVERLRAFVLEQPPEGRSPEQFLTQLAERLLEAGLPLWRLSTTLLSFDPYVVGAQYRWVRGEGVQIFSRHRDLLQSDSYRKSPVEAALERGLETRCRLDVPEDQLPYPTLVDLARGGGKDYLIVPLPMSEGLSSARFHLEQQRGWISFASDHSAGFEDEQVQTLRGILPALGLRLALETSKASARSLLRAYLGANAAGRVLEGSFKRGSAEPIDAVIWYCDLRGFTQMSDELGAREVVRTLDRYFEAVAQPIEDRGGEVLKFVGDAVLAIFPVGQECPQAPARLAIEAVGEARANLRALNQERAAQGAAPLGFGIALHLGEVMYGNIGSRTRLDFTVIGPPVNEVCRVEPLTRTLGADVLLTAQFVRAAALPPGAVISQGEHLLKGVSGAREVFALPAEVASAGS